MNLSLPALPALGCDRWTSVMSSPGPTGGELEKYRRKGPQDLALGVSANGPRWRLCRCKANDTRPAPEAAMPDRIADDPPELLTITEAADVLRTPVATLRYWRHQGIGPRSFRLGRRVLYRRDDVHAWINAKRENAVPTDA
jgi:excisionase family DNA binding protein